MKLIVLLSLLYLGFLIPKGVSGQTTDSSYTKIMNMNFYDYLDKPIDSLIVAIPQNYTAIKIYGYSYSKPTAGVLVVTYGNNTTLRIKTKHFLFMNPTDPNRVWNVEQFKKEKCHFIAYFYKGVWEKEALNE